MITILLDCLTSVELTIKSIKHERLVIPIATMNTVKSNTISGYRV